MDKVISKKWEIGRLAFISGSFTTTERKTLGLLSNMRCRTPAGISRMFPLYYSNLFWIIWWFKILSSFQIRDPISRFMPMNYWWANLEGASNLWFPVIQLSCLSKVEIFDRHLFFHRVFIITWFRLIRNYLFEISRWRSIFSQILNEFFLKMKITLFKVSFFT